MASIKQEVIAVMGTAFTAVFQEIAPEAGSRTVDPQVHSSQHADFQADAAMGMAKRLQGNPREIAKHVLEKISAPGLIASAEIAGPGFINIKISESALTERLTAMGDHARLGVVPVDPQVIVVDYSAPNVAKEMHVGHLRSTIIGDACVRLLEWLGHTVIRRNHVGDWGTPFGMLIEHLLDTGETQAAEELSLGDLNSFYKSARQKFEVSEEFQNRARARVVSLQSGDKETRRLWKLLIDQSQKYFISVYERMDVKLDGTEFFGESAYNDALDVTLAELTAKHLIVNSDGAECLYPEGFTNRDNKPLPLIVRKGDGGYGYAATDLAAIRDRTQQLAANRILYVVGAPQRQHLEMIFEAGRMSGWLAPPTTAEHISFGSVLGSDGKMFKSRSGETIKLSDLLTEAVNRAASAIDVKNPDLDSHERAQASEIVGIGAIKYADLSSERTRDYVFDFDLMLALEGNTGPYLQYAYARIQSILRQADPDEKMGVIRPEQDAERELALQILQFAEIVGEVSQSLLFHRLANYLFALASAYSRFYTNCPVLRAEDLAVRQSRLALCKLTAEVLSTGLSLLGIRAPARM